MEAASGDATIKVDAWAEAQPKAAMTEEPKVAHSESKLISALREEEEAERAKAKKKEEEAAAAVEAMADDVLHRILRKLQENRMRPIDLFRKIGSRGDEGCDAHQLCDGLLWMGFEPSAKEFEVLMGRLDKDGTEGVTMKTFDMALKAAERKRADPIQTAAKVNRRAHTALAALRSARPAVVAACDGCGHKFEENDESEHCKYCGTKRPDTERTVRKLLGYTPVVSSITEPMTAADEFMLKIVAQMNARKYRSIDFFRTMDRDSSGIVSEEEFKVGLKKMGMKPSKQEFDLVMARLDEDGSGEVSGTEFDKAAKMVVKKAKMDGRFDELDTWRAGSCAGSTGDPFLVSMSSFNWHQRSIRATPSGSFTERSARLHGQWSAASGGPHARSDSMPIGNGSIYDTSVSRERYFDSACSGAHPTSTKMPPLPLHKTVYKKAYFDGRFGKEPSTVPHPKMLRSNEMDRCLTATRGKFFNSHRGSVRTYHNTPMMQSSVDQAVFNRDMDFSGDSKFDQNFMALYKGCAGMSSWFSSKD